MRAADATRVALGVALVASPGLPVRMTGTDDGSLVEGVLRALGIRYVVQGAGVAAVDEPWALTLSAAVELTHAASLVALAAASPTYRRLSALGAVVATALGTADVVERRG